MARCAKSSQSNKTNLVVNTNTRTLKMPEINDSVFLLTIIILDIVYHDFELVIAWFLELRWEEESCDGASIEDEQGEADESGYEADDETED